jgi:hypothetical protein
MDFSFDPVADGAALAALIVALIEHMQKQTVDPSKKKSQLMTVLGELS